MEQEFIKTDFPDYVMIQTVTFCNAQCIMCPHKESTKIVSQGIMEDSLFKKIIDECSRHNVKRILMYLMNEPMIDKKLVEKINYAKTKNPNAIVHIVSNGSLLNEKLSKKIINSKIDYIEFSVHGIKKETYEKIMKKLDFNKTIKEISRFIELAKKSNKGEEYVNIKLLGMPGILNSNEAKQAIEFWESKGANVSYNQGPISRAGNVAWMPKVSKKEIKGCASIWRNDMLHILFNGDVVLCCMDWKRDVVLGNVGEKSIEEVWQSEKRERIEKMIRGIIPSPDDFICKKCEESIPTVKVYE